MPRVSVITGYYNRVQFLERTILSVLEQSFTDFELIVFDDCSTDGTAAHLLALADQVKDPRLKPMLHERNLGFVRGMIQAIAQSSGEFVAVQGSGDVSLPTRLEEQVALIDSDPGIVLCGCYYTNVIEDSRIRRPRFPDARDVTFESLLEKGNKFSHGEVMYRRSAYEAAGGYRPAFRASQDYDLWLRMIRQGRFATVRENLYDRYVLFDGVSYDPQKVQGQIRYSMLARRIARMDPTEAARTLALLDEKGPMDLVPNSDPEVQKEILKTALRALAWGSTISARGVSVNLQNPLYRAAFAVADSALTGPTEGLLRPLLNGFTGIQTKRT